MLGLMYLPRLEVLVKIKRTIGNARTPDPAGFMPYSHEKTGLSSYLLSPVYNSRATHRKIIVFGSQVTAQDTDSVNAFNM